MFLSNPAIVTAAIWLLAYLLHSFQVFDFYIIPEDVDTALIFSFAFIVLFFACISIYMARSMRYYDISLIAYSKKWLNSSMSWLLWLYGVISVFDIFYSGGFPMLWVVLGIPKSYVDFGLPTIHGIANSALFSYVVLWSIVRFSKAYKISTRSLIILFLYQVAIFSRGAIIVSIIEGLCIYLFFTRIDSKKLLQLLLLFLCSLFLFGIAGNIRTGFNPYIVSLNPEFEYFSEGCQSLLLWFYAYFTGGLNNVYANLSIDGLGYPFFTIAKLVPSLVYSTFGIEKDIDTFSLVVSHLNVSTALSGYISDFGVSGVIYYLWVPIFSSVIFYLARRGNTMALFSLPVFFQAAVHSIFIDTLLYTVFFFQFFLLFIVSRKVARLKYLLISSRIESLNSIKNL